MDHLTGAGEQNYSLLPPTSSGYSDDARFSSDFEDGDSGRRSRSRRPERSCSRRFKSPREQSPANNIRSSSFLRTYLLPTIHKLTSIELSGVPWLYEISACAFSVACMTSIVVVLIVEDGKPIDQWNMIIPANAVVSFLSTIAKSAFLLVLSEIISQLKWNHYRNESHPLEDFEIFDAASRGPWGSLLLLLRRHYHAMLASCAALIILAALLVDPFVQLAVRSPSRPFSLPPDAEAIFETTTVYNPQAFPVDGNDNHDAAAAIFGRMQAAIISGLFTEQLSHKLSCSTGNCTFVDMSTLGVCSACKNITSEAKLRPSGNYTMPSGQVLMASEMTPQPVHGYYSTQYARYGTTAWNATAVPRWSFHQPDFEDNPYVNLVSFEAIQAQADIADGYCAWQCVMYWCGITFESVNVTAGRTSFSTPIITHLDLNPISHSPQGPDGQWFLIYDPSSNTTMPFAKSLQVNFQDHSNTKKYLSELFSTGWNSLGYSTQGAVALSAIDGQEVVRSAPLAGELFATSNDIPGLIARIATSMTEAVRTTPVQSAWNDTDPGLSSNTAAKTGTAFLWKACIEVHWAWLALPITLVTLSSYLLAIMVWVTRHERHILWKSSALAMLFYQLHNWSEDELRATGPTDLSRRAREMRGKIYHDWDLQVINTGK